MCNYDFPMHFQCNNCSAEAVEQNSSVLLFKQRVFTFGKGRSEGNKAMKSLVSILYLSQ